MIYSAVIFAVLPMVALAVTNPLGPYKVSDVTVSGFSSGGYMAVQVHIALSSLVNGSAIFGGGPYYCAQGNLMTAEYQCMKTYEGLPNLNTLITMTRNFEKSGLIDRTSNLLDDRVYLFSGSADTVVAPEVVDALQSYYQFLIPPRNLVADFNVKAQHCWPTLDFGEECSTLGSPFIGKCNFDGAASAFRTLFGEGMREPVVATSNNLMTFSQTPFITGKSSSIADRGYIYVPTACQQGAECRLHISFHGCQQSEEYIDSQYAKNVHLNEWAESNNIIVLYPYVARSMSMPSNPNGCWDWWGYTDNYYGVNTGVQIRFVRSLIDAITGVAPAK